MKEDLQTIFKKNIMPKRKEIFGIDNIFAVPKIEKVTINARVKRGSNIGEEKIFDTVKKITGQRPIFAKAKKSISNFKIREGATVGVKATLRGSKAMRFLDKLINVVLPRVRDFSGISESSMDGKGNLSIGIREHIVFPESASDDMSTLHGVQITITTTAKDNEKAIKLLKALGFPLKSKK